MELFFAIWTFLHVFIFRYSCIYVPCFDAGQGSQCHPEGLGCHVGPLAVHRKFPAVILGTESRGRNSKGRNYPHPHDYSLYYGAHQRISQAHRKPPGKRPNPTADQPHEQCSHPTPPLNCFSNQTYCAGRPHVGLCPICLVCIIFSLARFADSLQ